MVTTSDTFEERAVRFEPPARRYVMVVDGGGSFVGADSEGRLRITDVISDDLMWERDGRRLRHSNYGATLDVVETEGARSRLANAGRVLGTEEGLGGEPAWFEVVVGPAERPSEYLAHLREHGWVCLVEILGPQIVDSLQRIACTDDHADREPDRSRPQLCQGTALVKAAVEPISTWLARSYMQTDDIRLAHTPAIGVLTSDDGERAVQGWHSDYPYHWGIDADGKVPTPSGQTVMGVQRIVCVSAFTKERGATAFKLGSHALDAGPPEDWGLARDTYQPGHRAACGLPYSGPDADVIEAPAGSMIVFDTRTWHRAGVNRSERGRAAILMDTTPAYIVPYSDTSPAYKALLESDAYGGLNEREKAEIRRLMVHRFLGPAGPRSVIGTEADLTARLPSGRAGSRAANHEATQHKGAT